MDIEQLKLILETAQAAGEGAYSVALIWLAIELLKSLVASALIGGGIYAAYKVLSGILKNVVFKEKVRSIVGYIDTENSTETIRFLKWLEDCHNEKGWRE